MIRYYIGSGTNFSKIGIQKEVVEFSLPYVFFPVIGNWRLGCICFRRKIPHGGHSDLCTTSTTYSPTLPYLLKSLPPQVRTYYTAIVKTAKSEIFNIAYKIYSLSTTMIL